jgi:hypothetical protein
MAIRRQLIVAATAIWPKPNEPAWHRFTGKIRMPKLRQLG